MRYSLVLLWTCTAVLVVLCFANETVVLPLKRRDGGLLARGLLRNATLPLHGAVKDYGYFYATLTLGTPAQAFAVIVDTGSTITYVPCASCGSNCGSHHKGVAFDPAASESSEKVTCGTPECQCGRPACGCSAEQECTYSRTYAEQSSSAGLLIRDHLQMYDGAVDIIFGCETKETGEIFNQEADGILGLGNSEVSLVNQLVSGGMIDDVFSLCFGNVEGDGALMLGGEMLDIPDERFDEGYGTVLDSGTTFTYLPSEVFQQFRDKVNAFALSKGLHVTKGPDPKFHDICYGGAPPVDQRERLDTVFPSMEFHFAEATTLKVGPLNYLFMHTGEAGAYCLGVFDNGGSGTLLGGITFRDVLVQYDRRNQRAGFGQAQCQHIGLTYHCHERDEVGERTGTEAAEIMKGFRRRPWHRTNIAQARAEAAAQREVAQAETKRSEFMQRRLEDLIAQRSILDTKLQQGSTISNRVSELYVDYQRLQTEYETNRRSLHAERMARATLQASFDSTQKQLQAVEKDVQSLGTQLEAKQLAEEGQKDLRQKLSLARLSKQQLQTQSREQQTALRDAQAELRRQTSRIDDKDRQLHELQKELAALKKKAGVAATPIALPQDLRVDIPTSPIKAKHATENALTPATPGSAKAEAGASGSRIPAPSPIAGASVGFGVLSPSNSRIPKPL
ncbi:hypothetical protein WJX72_003142 [[Myrmecia] bisecta]|uniref:Peptidase A1 domain-containing protein n=1 Tax=[Myrmecia] bisecta TaxID=41462 RepID=A0AAW1PH78_9CHLO